MNDNAAGLGILVEEKDAESMNSVVGSESLLPPLPPSSSSLPLESGPTAAVTAVATGAATGAATPVADQGPKTMPTTVGKPIADPPVAVRLPSTKMKDEEMMYQSANSSSNSQYPESSTSTTLTRQGSSTSLASSASNSSNNAVLKRIKSGLKRLSSPLAGNQKQQAAAAHGAAAGSRDPDALKQLSIVTDPQQQAAFKRPFVPAHFPTVSDGSNASSASSTVPAAAVKHSHTNSSTSTKTADNFSTLLTTPMTSPIIAVNEKFRSRASSNGSDYHFPSHSGAEGNFYNINKSVLDQYDTIDDKVSYIELLKRQMGNEDAAYKITERRLLSSGWTSDAEVADLRKRRDAAMKQWQDNIDTLEDALYRSGS